MNRIEESRRKRFSGADIVGLAVLAVVLVGTDAFFVHRVKDAGSKHSGPVVLVWLLVVGAVCIGGGLFQAGRSRPWWESILIGAAAGALVGFVILVASNPSAGSRDCPGSGPCDTSFAAGAILLGVVLTPVFAACAGAGRAIGNLVFRRAGG